DARPGEVKLVLAVDARQLGGLAAHERAARLTADAGSALDELGDGLQIDPIGSDVVEKDERVGAGGADAVDALRREVRAAGPTRPALPREDELRPDRVGRGGEKSLAVERMEARERAEPGGAGRLDGRTQPFDHGVGCRDRDAGSLVRPLARLHVP